MRKINNTDSIELSNQVVIKYLNYYLSLKESPDYAVLINGHWGAGKTFFIKKFLKNKDDFIYISLYGLSSIDEINTRICEVSLQKMAENKTKQISDWSLYYDNQDQELKLTSYFPSGKKYTQPLTQCQVNPFEQIKGNLLIVKNKPKIDWIEKAESYGRKYTVVYYPNNSRPYVMLSENIQIVSETNFKNDDLGKFG